MAKQTTAGEGLASELARIAREFEPAVGDTAAQVAAYGIFLRHVEPLARVASPLPRLFGPSPHISPTPELIEAAAAEYSRDGRDPAVYFYQDFARACDGRAAHARGVHYTPPAVVAYMVRGAEEMCRETLNEPLANAVVLDPCCGAGTFPRFIAQHISPCPRIVGMELSPVASTIAAALLPDCEIVQANSLEDARIDTSGKPLVVIGNPPYSGHSSNRGAIGDLLADYREGLRERNPKWLQDDYVKFIRAAQDLIEHAGRGLLVFVTNHSYAFSPTFRAMRASLMRTFDEISILDLNGNAKLAGGRSERDENVFPIRMGVAISFMARTRGDSGCRARHASVRGSRQTKLEALADLSIASTPWRDIAPAKPFSLFVPHDPDLRDEFYRFTSLFELFREHSVGFVTSRDAFAVAFDRESLLERIAALRDGTMSEDQFRGMYPVGDLDVPAARRQLQSDPDWREKAVEVLYRPFDRRWTFFSSAVMERPRLPFMENLMKPNLALAVGRAGQATGSNEWDVVFCTNAPTDLNLFRRGGAMLFPRFVYREEEAVSNIAVTDVDADLLFHYIYALLHSSIYRMRYADLLRIDFPRIPLLENTSLLSSLAGLGERLLTVHLQHGTIPPPQPASAENCSMRIGGYELPRKYIEDRRRRELADKERITLERIRSAIVETARVLEKIDEIISSDPPWRR